MALSRERFKASDFDVRVDDYEHGLRRIVKVHILVTPPGYPWKTNIPHAAIAFDVEKNGSLIFDYVDDFGGIGNERSLVAMAKKYLRSKGYRV